MRYNSHYDIQIPNDDILSQNSYNYNILNHNYEIKSHNYDILSHNYEIQVIT